MSGFSYKPNAVRMRKRYQEDPEKFRAISRANRKANPETRENMRARMLKSRYGLELAEYERLFQKQKGLCAICKTAGPLDVDHCHGTQLVRGLLCGNCNRGIGCLKENPSILRAAIRYLLRHKTQTQRQQLSNHRK